MILENGKMEVKFVFIDRILVFKVLIINVFVICL